MFVSNNEADATKEIAVTIGKVVDASVEIGSYIKNTLGTIPEDLIGLAGGDWLHGQRRRNIERIEAKTVLLLENVKPEEMTEPSASIVKPLLESAADEAREEIQDLWAGLLASAMINGGRGVRRAFFDTVKNLEPVDAIVLRTIRDMTPSGVSNSRLEEEVRKKNISPTELLVSLRALDELKCIEWKTERAMAPQIVPYGRVLLEVCEFS